MYFANHIILITGQVRAPRSGQFSMEEYWFPIEECWFPIEEYWFYNTGSQFEGRVDIKALAASGDGSDRLPGAVVRERKMMILFYLQWRVLY